MGDDAGDAWACSQCGASGPAWRAIRRYYVRVGGGVERQALCAGCAPEYGVGVPYAGAGAGGRQ